MTNPVLKIDNLSKHFGSTIANQHICMDVYAGEVVGLAGENGSGKSTLLSQIAGIYQSDEGRNLLDGAEYAPRSALEANSRGIAMVVQELGTVSCLNVGHNVFLGRIKQFTKCGIVRERALSAALNEICDRWDVPRLNAQQMISTMDVESKKMVELVRALSIDPKILILDEITQSLSQNNREILFRVIRRFREEGRIVFIITHDVDEMISVTDRIITLRDGSVVGENISAQTTADEIKQKMVRRTMTGGYYRTEQKPDYAEAVLLRVTNLGVEGHFSPLSFEVHAGEILGFCGLSDSGIHSIGKALYGVLSEGKDGDIELVRSGIHIRSAEQALKSRMGYLPKDRDHDCLMLKASIRDNLSLTSLAELSGKFGCISSKKLDRITNELVRHYQVKCSDIDQQIGHLSGGNKQKINLGRWMDKDLDVLILDCPTRGVAVGVKAYIYQLMETARKRGLGIVLISDELTEVLGMSDRILVMKNGKVVSRMDRGADFTEQKVIEVMV